MKLHLCLQKDSQWKRMGVVRVPVCAYLCYTASASYVKKLIFTSLLKTMFRSGLSELLTPFLCANILASFFFPLFIS